jgi:hypothetical protein
MVDRAVLALALDDPASLRPLTPDALAAVRAAALRVPRETRVAVGEPAVLARLAAALLASHVGPPVPDGVAAELDQIVTAPAGGAAIA